MRGRDVDSEVEAHFVKTVVNGWSGQDTDGGVFEAEGFEGGTEIL